MYRHKTTAVIIYAVSNVMIMAVNCLREPQDYCRMCTLCPGDHNSNFKRRPKYESLDDNRYLRHSHCTRFKLKTIFQDRFKVHKFMTFLCYQKQKTKRNSPKLFSLRISSLLFLPLDVKFSVIPFWHFLKQYGNFIRLCHV